MTQPTVIAPKKPPGHVWFRHQSPGITGRFGNHGSKSASQGLFVSKWPNGLQMDGLAEMSLLNNNRQTPTHMELRISACTDLGGMANLRAAKLFACVAFGEQRRPLMKQGKWHKTRTIRLLRFSGFCSRSPTHHFGPETAPVVAGPPSRRGTLQVGVC